VAARLALLAAAALGVGVAVHGLGRTGACDRAGDRLVTAISARAGDLGARARAIAADCDAPRDLVAAAIRLTAVRDRADALLLSRRATDEAPGDYLGWLALARILPAGDRERAVALGRVRELNPLVAPASR
jgi:hypothetical protein